MNMPIDAIRLRNFRGFKEAQLDLKSVTVLLGPNSSGKSSFGHALVALAHAHKLHGFQTAPSIAPANSREALDWPVDLGQFHNLRHAGESGPVFVDFRLPEGWFQYGFGIEGQEDLRLSELIFPVGIETTSVIATDFQAETDEGAKTLSVSTGGPLSSQAGVGKLELKRTEGSRWRHEGVDCVLGLEGLSLGAVKHAGGTEMVVNQSSRTEIGPFLDQLTYLRATREMPRRGYLTGTGERQEIGYSGEWVTTVLEKRSKDDVVYFQPPRIPTSLDEAKVIGEWKRIPSTLGEAVDFWLLHLGLATGVKLAPSERDPGRVNAGIIPAGEAAGIKQLHDITDVGFGISQVLPVLVAGLLQGSKGVLIIDLPEAHLHPRPQAQLADFFCSMAMAGQRTILETHSEMLFHRLRLRSAMTRAVLDQTSVYFLDPAGHGKCSPPRAAGLSYDDEVKWPAGFLDEGLEMETQISIVRSAQK